MAQAHFVRLSSPNPICYRQFFNYLTSTCHHAVRTISSPYLGVGRSWADYCWDSLPSLYTFQGTKTLLGLARYCLCGLYRYPLKSSTEFIRYGQFFLTSYNTQMICICLYFFAFILINFKIFMDC